MKNGKLIAAFLLSLIILSSSISVAQQVVIEPKDIDADNEIIKEVPQINIGNNTTYGFFTMGPRAFTITKITVQNGTFNNKTLFGLNLLMTIALRLSLWKNPLMRPITYMVLPPGTVDFTIEYKRDIPLGLYSRNRYFTLIDEMVDGNSTNNSIEIWNQKHTVEVEGFYGIFMKTKRSVLMAPSYMIVGICDKYTLTQ